MVVAAGSENRREGIRARIQAGSRRTLISAGRQAGTEECWKVKGYRSGTG